MENQRAEGLSKSDVIRCFRRLIVHEVFNALEEDLLQD
jgi:hypothetical protein